MGAKIDRRSRMPTVISTGHHSASNSLQQAEKSSRSHGHEGGFANFLKDTIKAADKASQSANRAIQS